MSKQELKIQCEFAQDGEELNAVLEETLRSFVRRCMTHSGAYGADACSGR